MNAAEIRQIRAAMRASAIPYTMDTNYATTINRFWEFWNNYPPVLKNLGDALWMGPIRKACDYYAIIDDVNLRTDNFKTLIQYWYYFTMMLLRHPYARVPKDRWLPIHDAWLNAEPMEFIRDHSDNYAEIENDIMSRPIDFRPVLHMEFKALLLIYINYLRRTLVDNMISYKKDNKDTKSAIPAKEHPIYGGIGDYADLHYGPQNLISSNDITGLIVKLKTVYMRAAYAQLIQTLSQMAEKKLYKTITFRQDEIKQILMQIKKLSADTFHQLKVEDRLINSMAMKIIKMVDPNIDVDRTEKQLALELGEYPPRAFRVVSTARD